MLCVVFCDVAAEIAAEVPEVAAEVADEAPVPPAPADTAAESATDAASPAEVALEVAVAVDVTGYSPAIIHVPSACVSSVTAAPAALNVVENVPSVIVTVLPLESSGSTATIRRCTAPSLILYNVTVKPALVASQMICESSGVAVVAAVTFLVISCRFMLSIAIASLLNG